MYELQFFSDAACCKAINPGDNFLS